MICRKDKLSEQSSSFSGTS